MYLVGLMALLQILQIVHSQNYSSNDNCNVYDVFEGGNHTRCLYGLGCDSNCDEIVSVNDEIVVNDTEHKCVLHSSKCRTASEEECLRNSDDNGSWYYWNGTGCYFLHYNLVDCDDNNPLLVRVDPTSKQCRNRTFKECSSHAHAHAQVKWDYVRHKCIVDDSACVPCNASKAFLVEDTKFCEGYLRQCRYRSKAECDNRYTFVSGFNITWSTDYELCVQAEVECKDCNQGSLVVLPNFDICGYQCLDVDKATCNKGNDDSVYWNGTACYFYNKECTVCDDANPLVVNDNDNCYLYGRYCRHVNKIECLDIPETRWDHVNHVCIQ